MFLMLIVIMWCYLFSLICVGELIELMFVLLMSIDRVFIVLVVCVSSVC